MALCESGAVVGSVSGGCIEDDLIARYTRAWAGAGEDAARVSGPPVFAKYGVTADEAHRFGLPCGGTLELLIEFDPDAGALAELLSTLETGKLMQRSVRLQDGAVVQSLAATPATLLANAEQVVNTFGPEYRMLIIGAGQMSEYLATMALFSGFAVTVCDPREEYRSSWSVAGARVVSDMPDDVVSAMRPDRRTCVVALTHDPKLDDLALLQALDTDAFYVGGIGSIYGAAIAAILLTLLTEMLRGFGEYRLWIYTLTLMLILFFLPNGLVAPLWRKMTERFR